MEQISEHYDAASVVAAADVSGVPLRGHYITKGSRNSNWWMSDSRSAWCVNYFKTVLVDFVFRTA